MQVFGLNSGGGWKIKDIFKMQQKILFFIPLTEAVSQSMGYDRWMFLFF